MSLYQRNLVRGAAAVCVVLAMGYVVVASNLIGATVLIVLALLALHSARKDSR